MGRSSFVRLAEVINKHQEKRVVSVTVKPTLTDCSGTLWITDLMLQEGMPVTGYMPQTEDGYLAKWDGDAENESFAWYNGIVRSEATVILFNLGETSAGLDIHLYPKSSLAAGSVSFCQGVGGQQVSFPNALKAEDDLALLASTRECTKNGVPEKKEGFYQYSAAWDSHHNVKLEDGKSARVLFEIQQMQDGGVKF
ncbi:MAG: hypothetical protein Q4C77_09090 [Eubacteriales bacterium]|nr:hypothetical protein [Eubacteriales bacterium]